MARYSNLRFRVVSVNVRGVANATKRRAVFDKHRQNADILIFQEAHCTAECENIWANEWGGKAFFSHGTGAARGVAIFISKKLEGSISNVFSDQQGRTIIMDIKENEETVSLAAIYAPNEDSRNFFMELSQALTSRSEHKIVIGDFNLTLDVDLDRLNTYHNNNKAKEEVEQLMDKYLLKDIWRVRYEDTREYSWRKSGNINIASRIDLALVSSGLDQKIEYIQYLSSIKTDHRAIYMVVNIQGVERGTGFWKFNTSLLKNQNFLNNIEQELTKTLELTDQHDPCMRWEKLKQRIKKAAINFSKKQSSEDKLIIAQLSEKVNEYEARLPLSETEYKLLEETKAELEERIMERTKGIMFRSKARWYEEGEKNTQYFFALEKAKYNAKTCYKILKQDGTQIIEPQQILDEQRKFYKQLYSEDQEVRFSMQNTFGVTVSKEKRKLQNIQITVEDIKMAIKTMNNNRTPGEDGIPIDFYKVFWNKLQSPFYEMVMEVYNQKILHPSARKGILNLIPKANKDTRIIKNLRPITLLNTDYKIIEKVIANKMIPALEEIIHKDQRGFMKDRRISVNIRKMLDIMHKANSEDLEAVVLSLDFVKCFDKCSFSILHGSLNFFNFAELIQEWTKILYKDFTVKIQNNGYFSKQIDINKGVHQGGCCSSIYFLVIAEILAICLRSNTEIEGITWRDIQNILNQFADDMDIFSLASEKSIKAIYEELDKFRLQSGFTVSYEKTTLYRIGSLRHSDAQMYDLTQFSWSNKDITVLGVTITHEDIISKNYVDFLPKIRNILQAWYNRGLSLVGKVQVINSLVASQFVYKMMVLPAIPPNILKGFDNIIREFLWNNKKSKVAYDILQLPKKEGGLGLVNLRTKEKTLKATWPAILKKEEDYAQMVYDIMKANSLKEDIWRCTLCVEDVAVKKIHNQFWEDVLRSWSEFNFHHDWRIENQMIWMNSYLRIKNKPFMWSDTYSRGLKYVHQLYHNMVFKTEQQVWTEFGLTKLRYNSLKLIIPLQWKTFFTTNPKSVYFPIPPHTYDRMINQDSTCSSRGIYQYLSEDITRLSNKYNKWTEDLGEEISQDIYHLKGEFRHIYKTTNVPKYRSFQYRLLQRGIITNIQLVNWKIIESNLCTHCGEESETILHLLCTCKKAQNIWKEVSIYIQQRFETQTNLTPKQIILNKIAEPSGHVANFICLLTKQYIYSHRCLKRETTFNGLKAKIREIENIEKYIAVKNNREKIHQNKWAICPSRRMQSNQGQDPNLQGFIEQYITNMD